MRPLYLAGSNTRLNAQASIEGIMEDNKIYHIILLTSDDKSQKLSTVFLMPSITRISANALFFFFVIVTKVFIRGEHLWEIYVLILSLYAQILFSQLFHL